MQKYWVETFSADWADEFDVHFFDVYTDTERNNINWLGKKFPNLKLDYGFGTNEWWDADQGFKLEVCGQEATEEEIETLQKFRVHGESLKGRFIDFIYELLDKNTIDAWRRQYNSVLNVPEDVFQAYDFNLDNVWGGYCVC